ncbi:hypothetical protein DIPPA_10734 [Diplonema papillatum]|nr:hypothetical protein DIPPA_10734 [Diplonema papillatum]|eukprot:gene16882-25886_t
MKQSDEGGWNGWNSDAEDDLSTWMSPLGKGTTGLGQESDAAIEEYQRQLRREWRQKKADQAKRDAGERERQTAQWATESKRRREEKEEAQRLREIAVLRTIQSRKQQEKEAANDVASRRAEWQTNIRDAKETSKSKRIRAKEEVSLKREENAQALRAKIQKERDLMERERQNMHLLRVEEVYALRERARISLRLKEEAVKNLVQRKIEIANSAKEEQKKKEVIRQGRLAENRDRLIADIREEQAEVKRRRQRCEEARDDYLFKEREKRKKETITLSETTGNRRDAVAIALRQQHNVQREHELLLRQTKLAERPHSCTSPRQIASSLGSPRPPYSDMASTSSFSRLGAARNRPQSAPPDLPKWAAGSGAAAVKAADH